MATSNKAAAKATKTTKARAVAPVPSGKTPERKELEERLAGLQVEGVVGNAVLVQTFTKNLVGESDLPTTVAALRKHCEAVTGGDLRGAETMLVAQAGALNAMFHELARRSALNMGEHLGAMETYMRLAMKAQTQCRATLETLAAIKNPPVVFAKQANINHGGQQQVNNGPAALPAPGAPVALVADREVSVPVGARGKP
jgi:hypothetical protein